MTDEDFNDTPARTRGKGYPRTSLGDARGYITEAAKYGMSHHLDAFAQYLGHPKPSGGAFNHKIAAIRDWGLIHRAGTTVTLTPLAQRLALPTDPAQEARDLREAFDACEIFRDAYERNAKGQPLAPDAFGNAAVLNLGISANGRESFVRSFVKSAVLAGLAEEQSNGSFVLRVDGAGDTDEPSPRESQAQAGARAPSDAATEVRAPEPSVPKGLRSAFRQTWEFKGGQLDISLALAAPLPREAYAHIGGAMAELIGLLEASSTAEDVAEDRG